MKQRFSSREEEDYDDGAASQAREFSKLTKSMKVTNRRSSTSYDPEPSRITELSNQEDLNMSRRTYQSDYDDGAAAQASGFSELTKSMKVTNRRSSNSYDPEPSRITELSNQEDLNMSRRTYQSTELPDHQQQQPASIRMYTCKTCGRKFGSFQALGGHRASHNMKLVGPGIVGEDGTYQNYFQYKAKLHQCSICDKGYQTGQALGGHMRKHRELLDNQRLASTTSNIVHQQSAANHDHSNNVALRWAQMNAAAIFQYSNYARRYNTPHQATTEVGAGIGTETEGEAREILSEKFPNKRGLNFDLNLDLSENEELGLINDER